MESSLQGSNLNSDAIDEILQRSFAVSYKLRRYDVSTRIRNQYPVVIIIWEGEQVDDSRDRLTPFASIKFDKQWKIKYLEDTWVEAGHNHNNVIVQLARNATQGLKYKADFQLSNEVDLTFSCFEFSNFKESLRGVFDVFIYMDNAFPKKKVPHVRAIFEKHTYIFKDQETGVFHLGCKDRVFVKDVFNTDVNLTYLKNPIKYLGFKKFKTKYTGTLKDAVSNLNSLSYKLDLTKMESSDSIQMDPIFADDDYRINALKTNAVKRMCFQLPNEEDLNSFFVLVDNFNNNWRITASLDQYVANNWIVCRDLIALKDLINRSIKPNLFTYDHANILYFDPEMNFFTFHFKTLDRLFSLYKNCELKNKVDSDSNSKVYYNCHNGYCKAVNCKYAIYIYKDKNGIHLGYRNTALISDIEGSEFYEHLNSCYFLIRQKEHKEEQTGTAFKDFTMKVKDETDSEPFKAALEILKNL